MVKKRIKKGKCIIDFEGDLSREDKPKFRVSISGDCEKMNLDKLAKDIN